MITIDDIKNYFLFRKLHWGTGKDAIDFLVTECGELMDSYLREYRNEFVRNNEKISNIGFELADIFMMASIASYELTGKSLEENLIEKWKTKGYDLWEIKSKEFYIENIPLKYQNKRINEILKK